MAAKPPDAFLSYTRFDDRHDGGAISEFCRRLASAVQAVTGAPFEIFQDVEGIGIGEHWPGKLDRMLDEARFFIPILTPSYFTSEPCRDELAKFLRAEAERGRNDLVLPIYYIECDLLEEEDLRSADPLASTIHERQRQDWRDLRYEVFEAGTLRRALERLARGIASARRHTMPAPQPPPAASTPPPAPTTAQPTRSPPRAVATVPPPGTAFRDIDALWCPELVVIPPGEFLMGSTEDDAQAYSDEKPQHRVRIGYPLAVGRYPVTFEEYDHFCEQSRHQPPGDQGWGRGRRPVINVSWDDAKAYVEWLAAEAREPYRLLTEAEWEYACRGGTTTRYWWGDEISPESANYHGSDLGRTSEVGSYPGSPFQLYDMHGNVWEWVEDRWHETYQGAPEDGSPWLQGNDSRRVVRGGSWGFDPGFLRAACRIRFDSVSRDDGLGFRVARTLFTP
jgi:formylglycine-generating enzyme required for sulfatase activity